MCNKCTREIITEIPDSEIAFTVRCAGCDKTVYGFIQENCKQYIYDGAELGSTGR